RILNIYGAPQSHTDLYRIQWDKLMPNLEILHFNDHYLGCKECGTTSPVDYELEKEREIEENIAPSPDAAEKRAENERKRIECMRLCVQPWKKCPKLRIVYTGDWNYLSGTKLWDLNELWIDE